jgi:hypothetical protein
MAHSYEFEDVGKGDQGKILKTGMSDQDTEMMRH